MPITDPYASPHGGTAGRSGSCDMALGKLKAIVHRRRRGASCMYIIGYRFYIESFFGLIGYSASAAFSSGSTQPCLRRRWIYARFMRYLKYLLTYTRSTNKTDL